MLECPSRDHRLATDSPGYPHIVCERVRPCLSGDLQFAEEREAHVACGRYPRNSNFGLPIGLRPETPKIQKKNGLIFQYKMQLETVDFFCLFGPRVGWAPFWTLRKL